MGAGDVVVVQRHLLVRTAPSTLWQSFQSSPQTHELERERPEADLQHERFAVDVVAEDVVVEDGLEGGGHAARVRLDAQAALVALDQVVAHQQRLHVLNVEHHGRLRRRARVVVAIYQGRFNPEIPQFPN